MVLCIPKAVSHIIKCPLSRVGSGHFYKLCDPGPATRAILGCPVDTDHRGGITTVNSSYMFMTPGKTFSVLSTGPGLWTNSNDELADAALCGILKPRFKTGRL